MAENPYVNKVEYAGQTLMDLTGDTVTPSDVLNGATFHDRSGAPQTGNLITHNVYDGLDSTSTSDALSAKQGKVLNDNTVHNHQGDSDAVDYCQIGFNTTTNIPEIRVHDKVNNTWYHETLSPLNQATPNDALKSDITSLSSNKVNMAVFTKTDVTLPANAHLNVNDTFSVSGTVVAVVILSTPNNAYIFGSASWSNTTVTIGLYNSATSEVSGSVVYGVIYR